MPETTKRKKAEIRWPSKLTIDEQRLHYSLPFEDVEQRDYTAYRLIDFALILEELYPYKRGQRILDLGAGGGWTSEWFSRAGLSVVSLDISSHWLKIFKFRCPEIPFIVGDAENLPFRDNCFNFTNCYDALHHMPNREKVVQECYRVLDQGGRAVFMEPGSKHAESIQTRECMKRFGTVEESINPFELKKSCIRAGFKHAFIKATPTNFLRPHSSKLLRGWVGDILYGPLRTLVAVKGRAFVVAVK